MNDGSRPRWERVLLALELGSAGPARDRVVDWVMFVYAVGAAASIATTYHDTLVVLNAALAVPACLSLWARRRRPVAVAWLTVALSAVSAASVHAAQVAIFSAAIHA